MPAAAIRSAMLTGAVGLMLGPDIWPTIADVLAAHCRRWDFEMR
jgi:hypothetical protein